MRLHRFYTTKPLGEEILKVENADLIHQLLNIFRYKENDEVILFSNDVYNYRYSIYSSSKKEISFKLKDKQKGIVLNKRIILYMSLVKKDTFEHIVRSCTELGVTQFVPIIADRSEKKNLNEERLKIIAIEATEQCGRTDVPIISPIISFKDAISLLKNKENVAVASLFGENINSEKVKKILSYKEIHVFIGPEGGWSDNEEKLFDEMCFTKVKLTDTILRADTGAQTMISLSVLN